MTLSLVVVAQSHEELAKFSLENVLGSVDELTLLANPDGRFGGLGYIGNHALNALRCDVAGMVHADVVFGPGTLRNFERIAMTGAVVGMVGRRVGGDYVWCQEVEEPAPVSTLDSCTIFIPRKQDVRFDVNLFPGFHCCIEDFCLESASRGMPILVGPGAAEHIGTNWKKPDWQSEYWAYRQKLGQKWAGVAFETT